MLPRAVVKVNVIVKVVFPSLFRSRFRSFSVVESVAVIVIVLFAKLNSAQPLERSEALSLWGERGEGLLEGLGVSPSPLAHARTILFTCFLHFSGKRFVHFGQTAYLCAAYTSRTFSSLNHTYETIQVFISLRLRVDGGGYFLPSRLKVTRSQLTQPKASL